MKRAWLTLILLCTVALPLRLLAGDGKDSGTNADHLTALIPLDQREELSIAGITIEGLPPGKRSVYMRKDGQWICTTAHNAVASDLEIEGFLSAIINAWGMPITPTDDGSAYGFNGEHPLRVSLHGPGMTNDSTGDVRFVLALGSSLPGLGEGRAYVRRGEARTLLEIDHNPSKRILPEDPSSKLPPLLDDRLLAGEWPSLGEGIQRAFVDRADGTSIEVRSRVLGPPPGPEAPPPREWIAIEGDQTARILPYRIGGWQSFLYRVHYLGLADPSIADRRGLDKPMATITLIQVDGTPIELVVGRSAPSGQAFILNRKTNMLCLLQEDEVKLLTPTVEGLCSTDIRNPWEAWLPK